MKHFPNSDKWSWRRYALYRVPVLVDNVVVVVHNANAVDNVVVVDNVVIVVVISTVVILGIKVVVVFFPLNSRFD